jgi:hypothetical protein
MKILPIALLQHLLSHLVFGSFLAQQVQAKPQLQRRQQGTLVINKPRRQHLTMAVLELRIASKIEHQHLLDHGLVPQRKLAEEQLDSGKPTKQHRLLWL